VTNVFNVEIFKEMSNVLGLSIRYMKSQPLLNIYSYCKDKPGKRSKFKRISFKEFQQEYEKYFPDDLPNEVIFGTEWVNSMNTTSELVVSKAPPKRGVSYQPL